MSRIHPYQNIRKFSSAEREHSACGVGVIVSLRGEPSHDILRMAIKALATMHPRIGVASDGEIGPDGTALATSDGVGIMTQIPQEFMKKEYLRRAPPDSLKDSKTGKDRDLGVGVFFFPRDSNETEENCKQIIQTTLEDSCKQIIQTTLEKAGYKEYRWRETPIAADQLGKLGKDTYPRLKQLMILPKPGQSKKDFNADLYFIQRNIENRIKEKDLSGEGRNNFHISSMSANTMVYKSLSLGHRFMDLYLDLQKPDFKTAFVGLHGRFSTNTAPAWWRAHFKRILAHNGEINTLKGNINGMSKLEKIFAGSFGDRKDDILENLLNTAGADSDILDNAAQFLYHAGVSLPLVKTLLIPPAVRPGAGISEDEALLYKFTKTLSPSWEGPGMFVMIDGKTILIGGDLNGMRPTPYTIFGSADDPSTPNILVAGSERGMVHDLMEEGSNYTNLLDLKFKPGIMDATPNLQEAFRLELENERNKARNHLHNLAIMHGDLQPGKMLGVNIDPDSEQAPLGLLSHKQLVEMAVDEAQKKFGFKERVSEIENIERKMPSKDAFPYAGVG